MKVTKQALQKLGTTYKGYLEGDRVSQFFNDFAIKFGAGHWVAGSFNDRFISGVYTPGLDDSITGKIARVAKAGITGIEFHDSFFVKNDYTKDKDKIAEGKQALAKYELVPTSMNINLFSDPKWQLGGITNPNKSVREESIAYALQGVDIGREIGCESIGFWPGSDGWDYNFEVNYGKQLDRFIDGCISINKKAKAYGMKFGIEAKLHEPREGNMVTPTTHMTILVSKIVNEECGGNNMGVLVDYGHEQMYAVEPASMLYVAKRAGVEVVNFHLNDAKTHSNDEDRIAGTGDIWRFTDFCYATIDLGYQGWYSEDQYTYRTDPVKSMALSRELFANIMKKALLIYAKKDKLQKAQSTGDAIATINLIKKCILSGE
jgi:L-rhamnose isomerase